MAHTKTEVGATVGRSDDFRLVVHDVRIQPTVGIAVDSL